MAIAKIEPTGTHIQHGYLKVRVDIYPNPSDKTYPIHYVDKPIIPPAGYQGEVDTEGNPVDQEDCNSWIESLPTYKELNPCLCHLIKIDPEATLGDLIAEVQEIFDADTLIELDDILSKPITPRTRLAQLMKPKSGKGKIVPYGTNAKKLKDKIDKRFAGLEVEV